MQAHETLCEEVAVTMITDIATSPTTENTKDAVYLSSLSDVRKWLHGH